ncbi:MAG TPA: 4-aminobutyrate--2-oxoglutarate transaminase [Actinomycetota bacterium]|nr:4-aminobutyrate--2-oxoglutarate transaminase [Actinomycetota bacterium]
MGTINLVTDIPGPKSKAITDRKEQVVAEPLDLHAPVVIDHAEGAAFTDVDGNTFLEFSGGIGCHAVGYSHPKVVEAVVSAAKRFSHTDFTIIPYESYVELSERLVALTGGDRKVALFNSGAEAVENSVKIARAATGRQGIIAFEGAFHGRTLMAMSLTSRVQPYKSKFGPFAPEVYRVPFPYPYRSPDGDNAGVRALEAFERALVTQVDPDNVAAVIVEPIQGEGGFVVPTPDFLPGLAEICAKHGILLIADEIQTGYGRTGRFFAYEHAGIQPDLVLVAKSLANGYPLSGVIGRSDVMDSLGPSTIGGTYVGNPVACAAANAVLDVIEEEGLVDRANQIAKTIRERWDEVARQAPEVGDIRGMGAMIGVEFVKDPVTKEPNKEIVGKAIIGAMKRGVVALTCGIYKNVIRHLMPLVITDEQLEEGLDVLTDSVVSAR